LRRLAMALGVLPLRAWEASSPKVVSRMWCNASNRCADCAYG